MSDRETVDKETADEETEILEQQTEKPKRSKSRSALDGVQVSKLDASDESKRARGRKVQLDQDEPLEEAASEEPKEPEEEINVLMGATFSHIRDGLVGLGRNTNGSFVQPLFYADNPFTAQRAANSIQEEVKIEPFPIIQASWVLEGEVKTRRLAPVRWLPATAEEITAEERRIAEVQRRKKLENERRKILEKLKKLGLSEQELKIIAGNALD
jgi:hypothetical protein